ncbi:tRNA pseudouridine synthase [Melia azedarach]|uniref:tRNA pseudouridine synthase n=1 Tax=Melia azedarach TaxID=155640 RepID=A0ACC1Y195_MELAZ|nr:tRNA pseudouridine synthase [Melia azedarach]
MTKFSKHILQCKAECSKRLSNAARNEEEEVEESVEENAVEECEEVSESRNLSDSGTENPGMQRYLVAVEYIGTRFAGAQKQPQGRTVAGILEEAFSNFIGKPVRVSLSSRTDAGVHAVSNVCHVDLERTSKRKPGEILTPHDPAVVKRAVNHFLQKDNSDNTDITITDIRCVPSDFHARFRAQERMYLYRILSGQDSLSVFERQGAWHVPEDLDLRAMQEACKVLVGCHDFSSFRASACQAISPIRTLDELHVSEVVSTVFFPSINGKDLNNIIKDHSRVYSINSENDLLLSSVYNNGRSATPNIFGLRKKHRCYVVRVRARSFLYHQVRLIVGVLKAVGTGQLSVSDVKRILEAKTVTAAPPMAPACGLYLGYVRYDLPSEAETDTAESSVTSPTPASQKRRLT